MIVCKITMDRKPEVDYAKIFNNIMSLGDFMVTTNQDNFEMLLSSVEDEVTEDILRKILRKSKVDYFIHVYTPGDCLENDSIVNQWILTKLDKQLKIEIEKKQQAGLQQINRRLELLDKLADELKAAQAKLNEQLQNNSEEEAN